MLRDHRLMSTKNSIGDMKRSSYWFYKMKKRAIFAPLSRESRSCFQQCFSYLSISIDGENNYRQEKLSVLSCK